MSGVPPRGRVEQASQNGILRDHKRRIEILEALKSPFPSGAGAYQDVLQSFSPRILYQLSPIVALDPSTNVNYDFYPSRVLNDDSNGYIISQDGVVNGDGPPSRPVGDPGLFGAYFDGKGDVGHRDYGTAGSLSYGMMHTGPTLDPKMIGVDTAVSGPYTIGIWIRPHTCQDIAISPILSGWGGRWFLNTVARVGDSTDPGQSLMCAGSYPLVWQQSNKLYDVGNVIAWAPDSSIVPGGDPEDVFSASCSSVGSSDQWSFLAMAFDADGVDGAVGCRCYLNGTLLAGPIHDRTDPGVFSGATDTLYLGVVAGLSQDFYYKGGMAGAFFLDAYVNASGIGAIYQSVINPTNAVGAVGQVLSVDANGNPVWRDPLVGPPAATDPAMPDSRAGVQYWNTVMKKQRLWTGSVWVSLVTDPDFP